MSLLVLSSVITAALAQGPVPAEEVVIRSMLRFEAVELRPIVTRARARCARKASLTGATLVAPCEAGTIGTGGQWLDLGKGRHTLDL